MSMLKRTRASHVVLTAGMASMLMAAPVLSQDAVQLTYWNWAPHIDEVIAIWNEQNPDIQVTVSRAAAAGEIVQKLSAAHTAGNPPDVTNVTYGDLPALIVNGLVTDLTPEMAPLQAEIAPVAWNLVTFDGTTWATPQGTSPMFFFYRKDLLGELGVEVPVDMAGQDLTVIVDGALDVAPGMALPAAVAPNLIHVFDLYSGARR